MVINVYIYADVLFIINIMMNSSILLLTAWTAGITYKIWRIMLAAAIGSCYVLFSMLANADILNTAFAKITMSLLLVLISFGYQSRRKLLLLLGSFYIVSFILGGAIVGWLYFWHTNHHMDTFTKVLMKLSWENLLFGGCLGIFLIVSIVRSMLLGKKHCQNLYQTTIEYNGKKVDITAMLDTGNGLYTPVGRKPVVIVDQSALEPILSEGVVTYLRENSPDLWLTNLTQCTDVRWLDRTQIIPYHAIGSRSMLLAFKADCLLVASKSELIEVHDVIIAIYNGALSGDGRYAGLLHPQIINELYKKEGASVCA